MSDIDQQDDAYAERALLSGIDGQIQAAADKALDTAFDPSYWALEKFGISLFDNQIEIFENVIDLSTRYLAIIGARSSGKTYGVGAGACKLCIDIPDIQIGVFGPKSGQAVRVLDEIRTRILKKDKWEEYIDIDKTTKAKLYFKNGSTMEAHSAAIETMGEGWHFDIAIIDESQRVPSVSFSQRIVPMLSASRIAKVIQLGVPMFKNHFWKAFQNPLYKKLVYPWLECLKLYEGGAITVDGVDYPTFIVDQMPYSLKQKYFPNHPDLWYDSVTNMSVEDFMTQFMMEWLDDINTVLSEEDQLLLASGTHTLLQAENAGDVYYFGLDFAGGELVADKIKSDFSALCVWRKTLHGVKEKVFAIEWKGDLSTQFDEIIALIHPKVGVFKCRGGIADYGNMGAGMIDIMKRKGVPISGIFFNARETNSGKNYKNAIIENFVFELRNGRVKYPNIITTDTVSRLGFATTDPTIKAMKKHYDQWCVIERHRGLGLNHKIRAPDDSHDDGVFADAMALWCADKTGGKGIGWYSYRVPQNCAKPQSLSRFSRMFQGIPLIKQRINRGRI